jgi:hypothetical protein
MFETGSISGDPQVPSGQGRRDGSMYWFGWMWVGCGVESEVDSEVGSETSSVPPESTPEVPEGVSGAWSGDCLISPTLYVDLVELVELELELTEASGVVTGTGTLRTYPTLEGPIQDTFALAVAGSVDGDEVALVLDTGGSTTTTAALWLEAVVGEDTMGGPLAFVGDEVLPDFPHHDCLLGR